MYDVATLLSHLNSPYNQEHQANYPPLSLGTESLHLRMRYKDHDVIGARTLDASSGARHAVFIGVPTYEVGKYGRAYTFDGVDDALHVPYFSALSSSEFTMAFWLRVDDDSSSSAWQVVGRNQAAPYRVRFNPSTRAIGIEVDTVASGTKVADVDRSEYKLGRWFHLTIVVSSTDIKIYVDGSLSVTTSLGGGTRQTTNTDLVIGAQSTGSLHAPVAMKDFRFYSFVLLESSIDDVMGTEHLKSDGSSANNAIYVQSWYTAFWELIEGDLEFAQKQLYVTTATGPFLDLHGEPTQTVREPGEDDPTYRIRIISARRRLFGGVTVEDVIEIVASITGAAEPGNIQVFENERANGDHEPAYMRVRFNTAFLATKGFQVSEYPATITEIEKQLNLLAAGGVRVEVELQTASNWDTAIWDDANSIWGS